MFLKEFFKGLGAYGKAHRTISKYKLWSYIIFPGIISLFYILMLIAVGGIYFPSLSNYINARLIPDFMKGEAMKAVTAVLLWIFLLLMGYITYKQVVLIFLSPILSYLSEVTEKAVYSQPSPDLNFKDLIKDLVRGIVINVRNLFFMIILMIPAWMLVIIPLVGAVISPVLMFLIQFYFDGFSLMDYTLERKRYSVKESIRFARNNRPRVIGVGMGFMLMFIIPLVGWFTAPAYGTVAATLAALEKIEETSSASDTA
jgi:CysZ protein